MNHGDSAYRMILCVGAVRMQVAPSIRSERSLLSYPWTPVAL